MERDEKIKQQLANSEYIGDFLNETRQNIDNALSHKKGQQTAYGYVWKYLD